MLNKRDVINFLYIISFPMYGIGEYISAAYSPSIGYIIGIFVHLLIIVFYGIDILLKDEFSLKINWIYLLMTLMQLFCAASLFVSVSKHMPGTNLLGATTKSILLIAPFHAFVAVQLYNNKYKESFERNTFISFSWLLFINMVGFFVLGLNNETHSIEGRVAFPFLGGFYSGASLLAILSLMILHYVKKSMGNPLRVSYLVLYFVMNLVLLYLINSRLTLLIFLAVFLLFAFNLSQRVKGTFLISILTLPMLLNIGVLIYKILSLPVFVFLLRRVDLADVTTFNGRAFVWQRGLDWLWYDQRGLFFGNGDNGQYFLRLCEDIALLWAAKAENIHLHSTVLGTVVDQGLVGYGLLVLISYQVYVYYKREFLKHRPDGVFFSVMVFMIFVMQVGTFVAGGALGYVILAVLASRVSVNQESA